MNIRLLIFSTVIYCSSAFSQSLSPQVIASEGGYYTNAQGSLSVTVGEASAIETVNNSGINFILTQGFEQNESANVFPLKLVLFSGARNSHAVNLNWTVENETGIQSYTVQRSADGRSFVYVGEVKAADNSAHENKYGLKDDSAGVGTVYYKLLIKEKDGNKWFSWIVKINGKGDEFKVYPVPVKNQLYVSLYMVQPELKTLKLYNTAGVLLWTKSYTLAAGNQTISVDVANLPAGSYFLDGLGTQRIIIIKE